MASRGLVSTHGTTGLEFLGPAVDEGMLGQIGQAMVDAMADGLEELEFDGDLVAVARAASVATAGGFLEGLAAEPWIVPPVPPALSDLARTMARRGVDIAVLIKLTRLGQSVFWPAIMESAERAIDDPAERMRTLTLAFERFSTYLETLLDGAISDFQDERDRTMRGAHARRNETIQALLKGQDIDLDGASRTLGYELRRWHTAIALSDSGSAHDVLGGLEAVAVEVAQAVAATGSLVVPSGTRGLWAWLSTHERPTPEQFEQVRAISVGPGVLVAVGLPAHGARGFRRGHDDAMAAQRVALATDQVPPIALYADVEIVSLLSRDEQAARALVARELAGLTGTDRQSMTLRETVLAFLCCGNSATAAGRRLQVHTNTVRYRIDKAEEVLGRSLEGQQLHLQLALMLVAMLGSRALGHAE